MLDSIMTWLRIHIVKWLEPPKSIEIIDIVQIVIIAFVVYNLIVWMKNTRAYNLLKGILLILIFVVIANVFDMNVIIWLFSNLSLVAIVAVVIIFQPELRKMLEQMGHKNSLFSIFSLGNKTDDDNIRFSDHTLTELVRACFEMSETKTGALIVLERDLKLDEYENTGIPVDAVLSSQLLVNIFEKNTPLHDGAVIVRFNRVAAATCYLPLSENMGLSKKLGTRHRAGLGISEVSDSLTIIVSEETGTVSCAFEGGLVITGSPSELREHLHSVQKIRNASRVLRRKERNGGKKASAR